MNSVLNPFQMIQGFMTRGMTPKGIVKNMVGNNPIFNRLIDMAEQGDNAGVENFARNMLKERGLDLDREMENMKKSLNIK